MKQEMDLSKVVRDDSKGSVKTGIQRCVIVNVEEAVSKTSGKDMIVITVRPSGSNAKVKTYIVDNENLNRNMTEFYDAFPTIKFGNENILEWIGAIGAANFITDNEGWLRVKRFVEPARTVGLPEFEGDIPVQQTVVKLDDLTDVEDDNVPF